MTETPRATSGAYVSSSEFDEPERTGWVGWILYAGVMMIMLGAFQAIAGLVAIFDDNYYNVRDSGLVVHVDYTAWGVVHLVFGALAVLGGFALMTGKMWARVYAVILAMLSAVYNLAFLEANPVWAVMMITIDALIIWAVCVHGREAKGLV